MSKIFEKIPVLNTLKGRVVIIITVTAFILSFTVLFIRNNDTKKIVITKFYRTAENKAAKYEKYYLEPINLVSESAYTISNIYSNYPDFYQKNIKNDFLKIVKPLIYKYDYLQGVWITLEPEIKNNSNFEDVFSGNYFLQFYRNKTGVLTEYNKIDEITPIEFDERYNNAKKTKQLTTTDVYIKQYSLSIKDKHTVVSIISPIVRKDKFIGAIGFDIDIEKVNKKIPENDSLGTPIIVTNSGTIVYHPDKRNILKNILSLYPKHDRLYNFIFKVRNGNKFFAGEYDDEFDEFLTFSPIKFKEEIKPWSVVYVVPKKLLTTEIIKKHIFAFFLMIIAIGIFLLITIIAASFISKPINSLINIINDLALGKYETDVEEELGSYTTKELVSIKKSIIKLRDGLIKIKEFAQAIGEGKFDTKYEKISKYDTIGEALIYMRDSLKENERIRKEREKADQIAKWHNEGIAKFSEIVRLNTENLEDLLFSVIKNLVEYIEAVQGGIYVLVDQDDEGKKIEPYLELESVFAYDRRRYIKKKIKLGDGLVGACAYEKQKILLKKVPDDYIDIYSGLGTAKPSSLLLVPLITNFRVYGVIEIASFKQIEQYQVNFIDRISETIASAISNLQISERTARLLEVSRQQSEEMKRKNEQLAKYIQDLEKAKKEAANREIELNAFADALKNFNLVAVFSVDGRLIDINENYLIALKTNKKQILYENYLSVFNVPYDNIDEFHDIWHKVSVEGVKQSIEIKIQKSDFTLYLDAQFTPIMDADGNILKVINIANNITLRHNYFDMVNKLKAELAEKSTDLNEIQDLLKSLDNDYEKVKTQLDIVNKELDIALMKQEKAEKSAQFYKKELEKRIAKFRKIEKNLKTKRDELLDEIKRLKEKNDEE